MKTRKYLLLMVAALILAACGTSRIVPVTGRKQSVYSDNAEILTSSFSEYKNFVNTAKLSTNANNTAMVKRVGQKLATAVETYLRNNGYEAEVQNYNWEFNLVQDNQVNAFCMPGGKIVVYEGLLPVTQTEAALAIVLGHEIAHAVAYHSSEQYQKQIKQQTIGQVAGAVLTSAGMGTNTASTLSTLYGLGSQMATLKYSRDNETEADHIGLIFAAMAGYDPNEAITFWQRMAASSNNTTPAFLSTHPSDASRIANIQRLLPEALKYYKNSGVSTSASGKKATTPKTTKTIRIK
jgi:Putative Zn-dependent protease, contains TPR repeats